MDKDARQTDNDPDNKIDGTAGAGVPYDVGYGRPPRHSRFRPGQSGNPKGRRKGAKSTGTLLREILDEKVTVRDGNREKKITRHEAWLRQAINSALKGDAKASAAVIGLLKDVGQIEPEPVNPNDDARRRLAEEDKEIMKRLLAGHRKFEGEE